MGLFVTAGNEGIVALGSSYLGMIGVILCVSGIYQWNPGIFQGNGKDERYSVGNLCPNQPQGSVCVPVTPGIGLPGVAYACAIGWSVMLLVEVPYYFWFMKDK